MSHRPRATVAAMIGEVVGSFRLAQALERHRWGDLFAAEPTAGGPAVTLLLVDTGACGDRARVDRCIGDARTAAGLGQANIAPLVEAGVHADGRVYLATTRLGGQTLTARVRSAGRLSATQIAVVGRQVATALAAAHGKGLPHRDLAPDDIEIVAAPELPNGERVVVHGFGLAQLGGHRAPGYVAPEQWDDAGAADARSDTYALGCIVFEMACGHAPFGSGALEELRARHLSAPAPLARSVTPDVPGALEHLLSKLLEKRPEDRPKSLADLVRTFEVLGGGALATGPLAPTGMSSEALPSPVASAEALPGQAPIRVAPPPVRRAPAPVDTSPRYSEPPRKKGLPGWMVICGGLILAAILVAIVVLATHK